MMRILRILGGLRLTLFGIVLIATGVLLNIYIPGNLDLFISGPVVFLSVNLLAAIITRPVMRQQRALLLFHLCLLALVVLVLLGRLTHFNGQVELTEGQLLEAANLVTVSNGPWYRNTLTDIQLQQGPIQVAYTTQNYRQETHSQTLLTSAQGVTEAVMIDDNNPLLIDNYRFYITSNKGFSAILRWADLAGQTVLGAVNFPSYPALDFKQIQQWVTPEGEKLSLQLIIENIADPDNNWILSSKVATPRLDVIVNGKVHTSLFPGDSMKLTGGEFQFMQLKMWMGYHINYDPGSQWVFLIALLGLLAMSLHLYGRQVNAPTLVRKLAVVEK
jgi:cytochrome c biogenesis protein